MSWGSREYFVYPHAHLWSWALWRMHALAHGIEFPNCMLVKCFLEIGSWTLTPEAWALVMGLAVHTGWAWSVIPLSLRFLLLLKRLAHSSNTLENKSANLFAMAESDIQVSFAWQPVQLLTRRMPVGAQHEVLCAHWEAKSTRPWR